MEKEIFELYLQEIKRAEDIYRGKGRDLTADILADTGIRVGESHNRQKRAGTLANLMFLDRYIILLSQDIDSTLMEGIWDMVQNIPETMGTDGYFLCEEQPVCIADVIGAYIGK